VQSREFNKYGQMPGEFCQGLRLDIVI